MKSQERDLGWLTISSEEWDAERRIVDAGEVGTGGAALEAVDFSIEAYSGRPASAALDRWDGAADTFPYGEVLAHCQSVGRLRIDNEVLDRLRTIAARADELPLADWLQMTVDQTTGDYATYVGTAYLDGVVRLGPPDTHRRRTDAVVVAAVGELIDYEVSALVANPRPEQATRARATARLLGWMNELAPEISLDPMIDRLGKVAMNESGTDAFVELAARAASTMLSGLPPEIASVVHRAMVPTTRLHDERMFVRVIQIFEGMYRQVGDLLADTTSALAAGDGADAAHRLRCAADRLTAVSPLFRILTTMPAESFAVIRNFTHGRSAIQSSSYWQVETTSAPRDVCAAAPVRRPRSGTTQEAFLAAADGLAERAVVEDAMRQVDKSWCAMKRGHWGIALKIIGTVPGTGGTDGAEYLRSSAETRLFPALAETA